MERLQKLAMDYLKFLKQTFSPDEESLKKEKRRKDEFIGCCENECFPYFCSQDRCCQECRCQECRCQDCRCKNCCCSRDRLLSLLEGLLHFLSKLLKAYHVVSFMITYFTFVCFSVNLTIELTLDVSSSWTEINSDLQRFYFACTLFLLPSLAFNAFFVLSLFWDVVYAVMTKDGYRYIVMRIISLVIDLLAAGTWFGACGHLGLSVFVSDVLLIAYYKAGFLTILCSIFIPFCVYAKRNTEYFPRKKCFVECVCYFLAFVFFIITILAPTAYYLSEAGTNRIAFSFACPLLSFLLLVYFQFMGSREKESGLVFKVGVVGFMTLVYMVICTLFFTAHYQCGTRCQIKLPVKLSEDSRQTRDTQNAAKIPGYSICGKTWSSLELSVTDMAFLADLAYKIDNNNIKIGTLVNDYFRHRGLKWHVESINSKKPSLYHIRNDAQMIHIIGIRGTSDSRDWFENLKIWNEIAIFQMFFGIFSFTSLPETFVSRYVKVASMLDHHESYFDKLEEYIRQEISRDQTNGKRREFFLVGHSLGGGLAKIVGTKLKIPSIAFSSPGEVYNHMKYGYTLEDLEKYTTSFGARNDVVSWIDKPGGLLQNANCDNCGLLDIHSIRNTYGNLKKMCPG